FVKGQDFRHVGGDELDKLLAGKDPKAFRKLIGR
ncbi:hypothetical protein V7F62_21490, partial [Salmonella enterica subsp. enterica serovar Enteritidis]